LKLMPLANFGNVVINDENISFLSTAAHLGI